MLLLAASMKLKVVVIKRYSFTETMILNGMYLILDVLDIHLLRCVVGLIGLRSLHPDAGHYLRWMAIAKHSGSDAWMQGACT